MAEQEQIDELNSWFSTYGLITAERILGTFKISLPQSQLKEAIKTPASFYRLLTQLPLKNVFNGIVLTQANDYFIYAQKLFIDYLLSPEGSKGEEEQGAHTRDTLKIKQNELTSLGEDFNSVQLAHDTLIAHSQSTLIKISKAWNNAFEACIRQMFIALQEFNYDIKKSLIREAVQYVFIHGGSADLFMNKIRQIIGVNAHVAVNDTLQDCLSPLREIMSSLNTQTSNYFAQSLTIYNQAVQYRNDFYNRILEIIDTLGSLSGYKIDPIQDAINKEVLNFDKSIGE